MRQLFFVVFLIPLLGLLTGPLAAQEAEAGFDITHTVDLVFPQAIYFEIALALPGADLAQLRLRIQPEGRPEQILNFITDIPLAFEQEFVLANTSWPVPLGAPPDLFSEITYVWEILPRDQELILIEDSLVYEDDRLPWSSYVDESEPVRLTGPLTVANQDFDDAVARFNSVYALLRRETGIQPTINLLLYPEEIDPGCQLDRMGEPVVRGSTADNDENIDCDLALAERIFQAGNYEVLSVRDRPDLALQYLPTLFERFYLPLWNAAQVPAWFRIGLQQFYQPEADPDMYTVARQMLRTTRPFTLGQMNTLPDSAELERWMAQARGMVLYVSDRIGVDGLFELARSLASAENFELAYESALGEPLSLLLSNWQAWLFTAPGIAAYNYHPYLGITPTPQPTSTSTFTAVPLTPTVTLTPEPTLTSTSVVTRTPLPPTSTVTPRPAEGFIVRASPTPQAASSQSAQILPGVNNAQVFVLILGGAVILVLLLISWIITRRR